ncbi:MAG: hypothetical protein TQ37_10415 [Candidatus Synechococcus spongiarum 15L]|uniref:DUF4145 domain-containing protein n=1 Tax=Candidatus Synechococcus spongiarum 15L TaxID=1608419 RepID=A0A0G8ARU3_9SYNE|nr:MAG: hypothetical protein TQ37_10415 [Candidatus Synechococcus spongiarum 15L]
MSSLTHIEKLVLEKAFQMGGGYVLHFSDRTFAELFDQHKIDISSPEYEDLGSSKAKRLRRFWELEPDQLVGAVLSDMLNSYEIHCDISGRELDLGGKLLKKVHDIIGRLNGQAAAPHSSTTENEFLAREFAIPNLQKMPIDAQVISIINARLEEARVALGTGAHLSVIFLCGSVLEAVLRGAAQRDPANFNQASAAPKAANKSPKRFPEWSLAQLIDVACEVGVLQPDIKKFSHGLRDFRNYIHPHEQMISGFTPDQHTAELCFKVLKAALASVAGERG